MLYILSQSFIFYKPTSFQLSPIPPAALAGKSISAFLGLPDNPLYCPSHHCPRVPQRQDIIRGGLSRAICPRRSLEAMHCPHLQSILGPALLYNFCYVLWTWDSAKARTPAFITSPWKNPEAVALRGLDTSPRLPSHASHLIDLGSRGLIVHL